MRRPAIHLNNGQLISHRSDAIAAKSHLSRESARNQYRATPAADAIFASSVTPRATLPHPPIYHESKLCIAVLRLMLAGRRQHNVIDSVAKILETCQFAVASATCRPRGAYPPRTELIWATSIVATFGFNIDICARHVCHEHKPEHASVTGTQLR